MTARRCSISPRTPLVLVLTLVAALAAVAGIAWFAVTSAGE